MQFGLSFVALLEQFGLSFVALLEIYAVGGEKSGTCPLD